MTGELASETKPAATELDLTGLKCPLPALRVRRVLRGLPAGARLAVVCTDPLSGIDIPNAARETGATVESAERDGDTFRFRLRRAERPIPTA